MAQPPADRSAIKSDAQCFPLVPCLTRQATNRLDVFHYGQGRVIPVHFELYADARRYDSLGADLPMPVQIFQGRGDTIVDPQVVEAWAAVRPSVQLHMLDDNHQLLASLDAIWRLMEPFLFAGSYQQIP